jgi:hypothetical protein
MHDNRKITIAIWDMPNGETCKVSVSFPTFADMERVYSVHVQPIEKRDHGDGYTIEVYEPRRGYRWKLETAARYSRKRLEALAEDPDTFEKARNMFRRVLADLPTPTTPTPTSAEV